MKLLRKLNPILIGMMIGLIIFDAKDVWKTTAFIFALLAFQLIEVMMLLDFIRHKERLDEIESELNDN